jgi:hypothetical protein
MQTRMIDSRRAITQPATTRRSRRSVLAAALTLLMMASPFLAAAGELRNVLVNGSFEDWNGGEPAGWSVMVGANEGEGAKSSLGSGVDRGPGVHCLVLTGADSTRQWCAASQSVAAEPGDVFRFSGWFRSADVEAGTHRFRNSQAMVVAKGPNSPKINAWILGPVTGTTSWERREVYLQVPIGASAMDVAVFLSMNGSLACDDLALEKLTLQTATPDASRDERWAADVAFLGEMLPRLHIDPFTKTDAAQWEARVADLSAKVGTLNDDAVRLRLMELVALIGDAHSSIGSKERLRQLPIRLEFFGDDLRVLAVDQRCAELAGGRVVRIGHTGIADCLASVRPLVACETESWFRHQAPGMLANADLARSLGFADSTGAVEITVMAESGDEFTGRLAVPDSGQAVAFEILEPAPEARPLCRSENGNYWFRYLPDERTFYLQYNRCREDGARSIADFTRDAMAALDSIAVDRFVLDVRFNSGGGSGLLGGLMKDVATRQAAGRIASCFVITGRATFSAAALDALDFRQATGALVAGEPMGNKPNRCGQLNSFVLPNSGLKVWYSTKKFNRVPGDPPILQPDLPAERTWDDYVAGRDPVLERILAAESGD